MTAGKPLTAGWIVALLTALLVVVPGYGGTAEPPWCMFDLYEMNRKEGTPNYITEDFLLLAHAMATRRTVTDLENLVLRPSFEALATGIHQRLTQGKPSDPAARLAQDFMSLIVCLLSGAERPAAGAAARPDVVAAELDRIRGGEGVFPSELMGQPMDFSQFLLRGKYAEKDTLGRYFRAMKYAGAALFPVTASKAAGIGTDAADRLTRAALTIVETIHADPELLDRRERLAVRLTWLFGPPDDLTHVDYHAIAQETGDAPIADIRRRLLERARQTGRQPLILSGIVRESGLEPGVTPRDALTGWRFIPQRYTPDAAAFQQLVYDRVTVYQGQKTPFSMAIIDGKPVKGFPLGLELMALLGSETAAHRLSAADEQNYKGYAGARIRAEAILEGSMDIPTLMSTHLTILGEWLDRKGAEPNGPDGERRLNSALAFWTWNRYISLLYAKQSYTVAGKGLDMPAPARETAWIEPAPALYGRLAATAAAMKDGLSGNAGAADGMAPIVERLTAFQTLLDRCRRIAEAETRGTTPSGDDAAFLNDLDTALLHLTGEKDAPIVTDVHTEPNGGLVLQEAVGPPRVATVKLGDETGRGALFRYYEFKHPMDSRMTDAAWRETVVDPETFASIELSPGSWRSR